MMWVQILKAVQVALNCKRLKNRILQNINKNGGILKIESISQNFVINFLFFQRAKKRGMFLYQALKSHNGENVL